MFIFKKVVIMGLGYIGLPTAALIASKRINVHGVDVQPKVVEKINNGEIHIVEPDLDGVVRHVVQNGFLDASLAPVEADVFIIAVPTPFKNDYEPDISFVESSTKMVIPHLREGNLFIIESTSPIKTTEKMADFIFSSRPELKNKIFIAYCPERVLPGRVLYELENNDRVIGGIDEKSTQMAFEFYSIFVKGNLHKSNSRTAEMCKLVENSYRDVNVAFANELSIICDKADINVWELIKLANRHPRVKILQPGAGVGGHCIAVDPWFIVSDFKNEAHIIKSAREVNNSKADWVLDKIIKEARNFEKTNGRQPMIACMGLAFKPDIDDLRESPALHIVEKLAAQKLNVTAVEPNLKESHFKFPVVDSFENVQSKADIVAFLVAHKRFKLIDLSLFKNKIVLDFCGVMN